MPTSIHNPPHPIPDESLPPIAIGILSYNRAAEVVTTLDAFERIDYPREKLHLVVIDNASSDGTAEEVLRRYEGRVEVLALEENVGAVARNRAMMDRSEPYIFTFDEDCAPEHRSMIRRAVEFMEANPYFGALCFRSVNLYTGNTEFGNMGTFSRRRLRSGAYEGMFVIGAGMCFRRDAIQRTRGYDERMFWGAEEYALGLELLYHDIPVALHPDLTLIHRHAPRAMPPAKALEVDTRNNIWSAFKFFPLPLAILVAAIHTGRRLVTATLKRKPGGREAVLRGMREGIRGLRDVMPHRTPIPVSRIARHNRWFFQMFYALGDRRSVRHGEEPPVGLGEPLRAERVGDDPLASEASRSISPSSNSPSNGHVADPPIAAPRNGHAPNGLAGGSPHPLGQTAAAPSSDRAHDVARDAA